MGNGRGFFPWIASEEEQERVCTRHCGGAIYGMKTLEMEYPESLEWTPNKVRTAERFPHE